MRDLVRLLGQLLLVLALAAALWCFGPCEPVDLKAGFEPRKFGEGVQVYSESTESRFDDIAPGVLAPGQTEAVVTDVLAWLRGQGIG